MHLFNLAQLWASAKKIGPIGIVLLVLQTILAKLLEDRLVGWANRKLDANAKPAIRLVATTVKFAVDHPWQAAVDVGFFILVLIVVRAFVETIRKQPGKPAVRSTKSEPPQPSRLLHHVGYSYLPRSPLDNGWAQAYGEESPSFGRDPSMNGSLQMVIAGNGRFAMDHWIPPHATLAERITFEAKYTHGTMIFTGIDVSAQGGLFRKKVWIKYQFGNRRAELTDNVPVSIGIGLLPEQTVWLPASNRDGGWLAFDINLPDIIKLALGVQGWLFDSIWAIRLRGSLSISPIKLYDR